MCIVFKQATQQLLCRFDKELGVGVRPEFLVKPAIDLAVAQASMAPNQTFGIAPDPGCTWNGRACFCPTNKEFLKQT